MQLPTAAVRPYTPAVCSAWLLWSMQAQLVHAHAADLGMHGELPVPRTSPPCQPTHTACTAGSFDHFLNFQIAFIILMQISMCLFCAVASYIWREQYGDRRYFLGLTQYTQVQSLAELVHCVSWKAAPESV